MSISILIPTLPDKSIPLGEVSPGHLVRLRNGCLALVTLSGRREKPGVVILEHQNTLFFWGVDDSTCKQIRQGRGDYAIVRDIGLVDRIGVER